MNLLEYASALSVIFTKNYYNSMQIGFHIIEHQVEVLIIFSLDDVEQSNNVLMAIELL